ncbi:hypothetical protein BDR22DRAFT_888588 [Usnea florida]
MDAFVAKGSLHIPDVLQLCPASLQLLAATPFWPGWFPSQDNDFHSPEMEDWLRYHNLDLSDSQFPFATTILKAILQTTVGGTFPPDNSNPSNFYQLSLYGVLDGRFNYDEPRASNLAITARSVFLAKWPPYLWNVTMVPNRFEGQPDLPSLRPRVWTG